MGCYGIGPGRIDGGGGRAAPRRARHRLADGRSRRTTCTSSCSPGSRSSGRRSLRRSRRAGHDVLLDDRDQRAGREVRRRRPDRRTDARDGREEDARGRRRRRARPRDRGRARVSRWPSSERFRRWPAGGGASRRAVRPDDRAADGRDRHDVPRARGPHGALGRLPQPPRARQPSGPSNEVIAALAERSASSPSTSASTGSV